MFGILDWIKFGVPAAIGAVLGAGVAYQVGHWSGEADGRAAERTDALARSMDLIRERNDTNAEINALDDAGLCGALGGRWVPEQAICE